MFTLRIIEETRESKDAQFQQVIENFELGSYYSCLKRGLTKEFDDYMLPEFSKQDISKIRAVVIGENKLTMFIEENSENRRYSYFIMTENGKTFEKL